MTGEDARPGTVLFSIPIHPSRVRRRGARLPQSCPARGTPQSCAPGDTAALRRVPAQPARAGRASAAATGSCRANVRGAWVLLAVTSGEKLPCSSFLLPRDLLSRRTKIREIPCRFALRNEEP